MSENSESKKKALISLFAYWNDIKNDMSMVKCDECPFDPICKIDHKKGLGFSKLCDHLKRNITIVQQAWNLPDEVLK